MQWRANGYDVFVNAYTGEWCLKWRQDFSTGRHFCMFHIRGYAGLESQIIGLHAMIYTPYSRADLVGRGIKIYNIITPQPEPVLRSAPGILKPVSIVCNSELTRDTPCIAFMDEPWGVCCEDPVVM